jgi:hypothetical protein
MHAPAASERQQIGALGRAFLARFFDNEISDGSQDLTRSFIWLIAALAMPGFILPNITMNVWDLIGRGPGPFGGPQFLSMVSATLRVFSLGLTMLSVGAVAVVTWQALLIDRRDVLVLGSFPLRNRTLMAGKLLALVLFFAMLSVGMQSLGSIFFGLHIGGPAGEVHALRLAGSHFLVSTLAGLFVLLVVLAVQSVAMLICGPRLFAHASPVLQMGMVGALLALFILLPSIADAAVATMYRIGRSPAAPWILYTPPVWFLGLYDQFLGSDTPLTRRLSTTAGLALAVAGSLTALAYPLAFRRIVRDALLSTAVPQRRSVIRRAAALVPVLVTRDPVQRATIQFALSVFGRVGMHRLVLSTGVGTALALAVTIVGASTVRVIEAPTAGLLSLGTVSMLCLLVAVRVAMAIPVELSGAWLFLAATSAGWTGYRTATRRLLWALGVVPPVAVSAVAFAAAWGPIVSLRHTGLLLSEAVLLTELLLIGLAAPPCTTPYEPGRARLASHWPVYGAALIWLTIQLPAVEAHEIAWGGATTLVAAFAMLTAGVACRFWSNRRALPPAGPDPRPYGLVLD